MKSEIEVQKTMTHYGGVFIFVYFYSNRNNGSDATESVQTNQCNQQLPEKEQQLKIGEQGLRR